ncbi:MAG: 2Fe-2S iron-sulfur cluster binding domain-containing protein [Acidobacteria bacterium]|nr:2Fe-2S iron-sulfur cluster binding domain-containing protein [Acidobacteriota bacterium]MCA1607962.1 2Fe-2S iron-sulfur cluster binding domain-containing protein [Acidobacteriota bacterium]
MDNLLRFTEVDWQKALDELLPEIHPVDRSPVRIWFRLYPLELQQYISTSDDLNVTVSNLGIQGEYSLENQIDSSHRFLYGHRYWPQVKYAIQNECASADGSLLTLPDLVRVIAANAAKEVNADISLLIAITAVGMMTVSQIGIAKFSAAVVVAEEPRGLTAKSPEKIIAERARDDSQGILGFLRTVDKKFSVIYDENNPGGRFQIVNDQQIAMASANDRSQNWQARDSRCWEGPIPVECLSASCGTCWIGVIAGQEKLSEVARRERRAMKVFGYNQPDEPKPLLRLACQAKAYGNVTIVIPPWNGVFGKQVYDNVEALDLKPATTSARVLRDTVRDSVSGSSND